MKPAPRIYERALEELGEAGSATLFVGDGANNELDGARAVGMTPVLFQPSTTQPRWTELDDWSGARISSIPEVLDLLT